MVARRRQKEPGAYQDDHQSVRDIQVGQSRLWSGVRRFGPTGASQAKAASESRDGAFPGVSDIFAQCLLYSIRSKVALFWEMHEVHPTPTATFGRFLRAWLPTFGEHLLTFFPGSDAACCNSEKRMRLWLIEVSKLAKLPW